VDHLPQTRIQETAKVDQALALNRRRLVRSERQRNDMKRWLDQGGMNDTFLRVRRAYEEAFFGDEDVRTPMSVPLVTAQGAAGFAFTTDHGASSETYSLVLDCLMGQISRMVGFQLVQAERWISRDAELGCDDHQCYTFRGDGSSIQRWLNALFGRPKGPFLYLRSVHRRGTAPRIEILWKGSADQPHRLHAFMERWLSQSPEGTDFSFLYTKKHLINRIWK
jgi:hypothetical protein